ncbi:MAG: hypothetical protein RIQ33_1655, partial [Bacteroidota bacterium]
MKIKSTILLFVIFLLSIMATKADNATDVKGFVYDKTTGEPMIFTTIILSGTKYGAQTDINGYFYIRNIPYGNYTVFVKSIGYDTSITDLVIKD